VLNLALKPRKKISNKTVFLATLILLSANSTAIHAADTEAKKVKTTAYKDIVLNVTHTLGGVVPAAQDSNISAQISAIINQFHVDTGHEVKKDDLLVSLDCREYQLLVKQAGANLKAEKVQLAHARIQFNQAKKLNKQGNISKETYNLREAEENRLKATVINKTAAEQLSKITAERCQVKAPFDGYITHRDASIGELTQPGTSLLQLVSKTNDIVETKINHRLLNSFSQGRNHQFIFNNKTYDLDIEFILPVLDTRTRNHIARLKFTKEKAITGSVGKIRWQDEKSSIPASYVVSRNNKLGVFVAEKNSDSDTTAKFIEIENATEGQPAIIKLDAKTQIITNGRFNVKHGDALKVTN
jgi:RND family efflux transporter MFP subunit